MREQFSSAAIRLCPGPRVQQGGYCQKSICCNVRSVALGTEESMPLAVCLTIVNEKIQLKCAKGLKQPGQMSSKPGICFWTTIRGKYTREGTPLPTSFSTCDSTWMYMSQGFPSAATRLIGCSLKTVKLFLYLTPVKILFLK